jgi:hypothetical protein
MKFIKDKQAILYDKNLGSEIDIEIKEAFHFVAIATWIANGYAQVNKFDLRIFETEKGLIWKVFI